MIDPNQTPYIIGGFLFITGALGWFVKTYILNPIKEFAETEKRVIAIEMSLKYYLETTGKGAAMALITPNPTPPEMSTLLQKYVDGRLTDEVERDMLRQWLKTLVRDPNLDGGKYQTAMQLLAALGAEKRLAQSA